MVNVVSTPETDFSALLRKIWNEEGNERSGAGMLWAQAHEQVRNRAGGFDFREETRAPIHTAEDLKELTSQVVMRMSEILDEVEKQLVEVLLNLERRERNPGAADPSSEFSGGFLRFPATTPVLPGGRGSQDS